MQQCISEGKVALTAMVQPFQRRDEMDADAVLLILAPIAAVVAAALSGAFAIRARTAEHRLAVQRERDEYLRDVIRLAEEPLLYAASDLQSRIFNIVEGSFVDAYARSDKERHRTNVYEYTVFLFAQYLGWAEAIRQGVMLRTMAEGSTSVARQGPTVISRIRLISDALRDDMFGRDFLLFAGEQHAIGELMFSWDTTIGRRLPTVRRYAEFAEQFRSDPDFRAWFAAIVEGIDVVNQPNVVARLSVVQNHLVDIMELLDPDHRVYKPRTRLRIDTGPQAAERHR